MPIPMILLTGSLGSGKTTLLNELLRRDWVREQRVALIINEFGALNIDAGLVESGELPKYEINNGSIFCICVKTDFIETLESIAGEVRPDLVIAEATGIAETRDIEAFIREPHLQGRFEVRANVCLVDTEHFVKLVATMRSVRNQVEWADGIVVNKTDRIGERDLRLLEELIETMNPDAPRVLVEYGRVPEGFIRSLKHVRREGEALTEPPDPVFTSTFRPEGVVDRAAFRAAVGDLGDRLLRLKGQVDFGEGPVFVEVINGELREKPDEPARRPGSAFVAIAWKTRQADLETVFQRAGAA